MAGLSKGGEILLKAQEFQAYSSTPLSSVAHLLEEAWAQSFPTRLFWPQLASLAYHLHKVWSGVCPGELRAAFI